MRRSIPILIAAGLLMSVALGVGVRTGDAHAYGHADQPLAQIELSGNCTNPSFPLCAPPPDGVGTGGIWFWIEIDANGTGDIAGAGCGHTVGGIGGPGGAGGGPIKGDVTWSSTDLLSGTAAGGQFFGTIDPNDSYYLVTIPDGEKFLFPTTQGHYSFQPANGVSLQLQVAP
ncbi:MAG TPA: hypothetical protein VFY90_03895 [Tepidiformaceae bacterium]|nr:hypothetical protein [Tepidiformaceae bacterium]